MLTTSKNLSNQIEIESNNDWCDGMKSKLFVSIVAHLKTYVIKKDISCTFHEGMVFVSIDDKNAIHGSVLCLLCNKKISVYCRVSKHEKTSYWIIGNFAKHLKNTHKLQSVKCSIETGINDTGEVELNSADEIASLSENLKCVDSLSNGICNEMNNLSPNVYDDETGTSNFEPNEGDDNFQKGNTCDDQLDVFATNKSICLDLSIERLDGSLRFDSGTAVNLETMMYRQISSQVTKMMESVLHDDNEEMHFEIENTVRSLTIVKIKNDGSCLFRALAHQLFCEKLGGRQQNLSTKNMRSDVVTFIKSNYEMFEHELKGCVFDRMNPDDIDDLDKECKIFLNSILPKSGCWGGVETIKAVSCKHRVNVLVINEFGPCYYVNGFNLEFTQTIIIAYRLGHESVRNHYDSVVKIELKDVYACAQMIADSMAKQQIASLQNKTMVLEDSVIKTNTEE